jgi:hypothetical protein
VAEVVEADGAQPNMKQQRLEAPLVYVGRFKELTNLCSECEILIAVQVPCAGDQIRPVPASSLEAHARPRSHS